MHGDTIPDAATLKARLLSRDSWEGGEALEGAVMNYVHKVAANQQWKSQSLRSRLALSWLYSFWQW